MFATNIGFSHVEFTGKLADLLVEAGNEVDYVLSVWHIASKNNGTQKANLIRRQNKDMGKLTEALNNMSIWNKNFDFEWDNEKMSRFGRVIEVHCEGYIENDFSTLFFRHFNRSRIARIFKISHL